MPIMKKLNRVINVSDADVTMYEANGYNHYQYQTEPAAKEMERGNSPAPDSIINNAMSDYNNMPDEELATLAAEKHIDIDGKTRKQVINALKKTEV